MAVNADLVALSKDCGRCVGRLKLDLEAEEEEEREEKTDTLSRGGTNSSRSDDKCEREKGLDASVLFFLY